MWVRGEASAKEEHINNTKCVLEERVKQWRSVDLRGILLLWYTFLPSKEFISIVNLLFTSKVRPILSSQNIQSTFSTHAIVKLSFCSPRNGKFKLSSHILGFLLATIPESDLEKSQWMSKYTLDQSRPTMSSPVLVPYRTDSERLALTAFLTRSSHTPSQFHSPGLRLRPSAEISDTFSLDCGVSLGETFRDCRCCCLCF